MTVPELIDRLEEINNSLNLGDSLPKILNEYTVNNIQSNVRTLISDLEDDGILDNEGYRQSGRVY
tara:strand:- start:1587 stop:1781 length:195 start_codon:yes stop_codon:yes gene_type:complete